jgi:predicted phosphoribosyltransferase
VLPPDLIRPLGTVAEDVVWLYAPEPMIAVGNWYDDFDQLSDAQVVEMLALADARG